MTPTAAATVSLATPGQQAGTQAARFAGYLNEILHQWLRTLTALAVTLIPLFVVLDYLTMPAELRLRFAAYRGMVTAACLVQYLIIRNSTPSRLSYLHGYATSVLASGMIVRMTVDLGGFNSSYYAGLNLVIVSVNLLLPWRSIHSALNGAIVVGMYLVANVLWGGPFSAAIVVNNLYFMISTVVIAVAINHSKLQLIQKEFSLREELLGANENLSRSRSELKAARDALWGEMEVAKRIQTALLPRNRRIGNYEVAAVMVPAAEVGGDYYDFVETATGEHWLTIGDVSGHGVESGLVMMMTQTSIFTTVNDQAGLEPSAVFRAVNAVVRENISRLQTSKYMTLNVARLLPDRLRVAGKHQDFMIRRAASGKVETLSNGGCWLGVVPDTQGFVDDQDLPVGVGDVVLLFTDGVTEATNTAGQMYGEERLAAALARLGDRPLGEALAALLDEVVKFPVAQDDDITLLMVRRLV